MNAQQQLNFNPGIHDILEFKDKLKQGFSAFNDIVSCSTFIYFWNIGDSDLVNFIVENIQHVIDCALFVKQVPRIVSNRCLALIVSNRAKAYNVLIKETHLLAIIVDFAQMLPGESRKTQNAYFSIMDGLTFNSTKLLPIFSTQEYIKTLISNLNINECYTFLALLLTNGNVNDVLSEVKFMDLIVEEIASKQETLKAAQSLFLKGFETPFANELLKSLLHDNCFSTIVQNTIEDPNPDSFDFLRYLSQIATQRNLWKQWKEVLSIIQARLPEFVNIMLKEKGFSRMSQAVASLVIVVFKYTKDDSIEVDKVFLRLGTDFWIYKTNSFLHNSFVQLLETYLTTKTLSRSLINKVNLFDRVYEAEMNRDNADNLVSYMGQVRQIATIINPFFKQSANKKVNVTHQQWKSMMDRLNASGKLIKKPYGGRIPWRVKYQQIKYDSIITFGILFFFSIAIIYVIIPVAK